jgi:hypothetical protein
MMPPPLSTLAALDTCKRRNGARLLERVGT